MNKAPVMEYGSLVVVSGPSGVGKGTVCKRLCAIAPQVVLSVSATTRPARPREQNGFHYHFLSREDFFAKRDAGDFLEWAEVYGNFYGTLRSQALLQLAAGYDVILEIDTQGAMNIRAAYPEAIFVFILPPSVAELQRRIISRATEDEETIRLRLSKAESEMLLTKEYDYSIVNDTVDQAAAELLAVIKREKLRRANMEEPCLINRPLIK